MVIEEPDIEIGTGVSSKGIIQSRSKPKTRLTISTAMSRRVGPEPGGGKHFNRNHGHHGHHGRNRGGFDPNAPRFRKPHNQPAPPHGEPRPEPHTIGVPPAVPGFGFQLPGV